ncbi:MAG: helix-turn-helix domain-containing protein [Actinophytocola sp.]|nr:helix-turn-helix domain-containing protein [Actinophytocola sp.]
MTAEERFAAFGERLSQLREAAGLSGVRLAKQVGWPASKTSRMQRAQQKITELDVRIWCEAVGAGEETAAELIGELRAIRLDQARWRTQLRGGHQPVQAAVGQSEQRAATIRVVSTGLVPGLLQTPDYARAVFSTLARVKGTRDDADAAVAARMQRQSVLYDSTKRIELLVTEAGLRQAIASPDVMAAQYDRLLGLLGMRSVRFGIVPLDAAYPFPLMHGWTILDDEVRVETLNTTLATNDPEDVQVYNDALDQLWSAAAEGDDARAILTRLVAPR